MTITTPLSAPAALLALAQAPGGMGAPGFLLEFAVIVAILYFLILRPQQKQRQQHEQSLRTVKKGDEVVTAGGIVGEVIHIREMPKGDKPSPMDDRITIKSGESRLVVERGRIARITSSSGASAPST